MVISAKSVINSELTAIIYMKIYLYSRVVPPLIVPETVLLQQDSANENFHDFAKHRVPIVVVVLLFLRALTVELKDFTAGTG